MSEYRSLFPSDPEPQCSLYFPSFHMPEDPQPSVDLNIAPLMEN